MVWFCDEVPENNEQRRLSWYRRLREWHERRLEEEVERIEELVGMGEVPRQLRRQAE